MFNLQTSLYQQSTGTGSRFGSTGAAVPAGTPSGAATGGQDQFGAFLSQLNSGKIKSNLNAPAPPYTATRSWSA